MTVSRDDLVRAYGADALNQQVVTTDMLPQLRPRDAEILRMGLPELPLPYVMPDLKAVDVSRVRVLPGAVRFAEDGLTELVILAEGSVLCLDSTGPDRPVNDSLDSFLEFAIRFDEYCRNDAGDSPDELMDGIPALREELRLVDPSAFADEESWWSVTLEAAEDGVL